MEAFKALPGLGRWPSIIYASLRLGKVWDMNGILKPLWTMNMPILPLLHPRHGLECFRNRGAISLIYESFIGMGFSLKSHTFY